ncbi:MAG: radical SAM protein [Oscillospiraceae bacterium]
MLLAKDVLVIDIVVLIMLFFVAEAEKLAKDGVKELIVVAQDTSRYGEDLYGSYKLAELLKKLCEIDGLVWIRTLYCYPDKITDELLSVVASEEKLVKYFDIPIQHCNGEILKSMNRKQNQTELKQLFARIRKAVPNVTLRTTLITGYPDETDEQFTELSEFVDEIKFDRLGCFQYSAEEGTKAATMPNQIEDDVKARREEIIMSQQAIIMENLNKEKIGQTIQVLVEGYDKFGECFFGRSKADAPDIDGKIFFESKNSYKMGDFAEVIIEDILDYDLVGSDKAGIKEYK